MNTFARRTAELAARGAALATTVYIGAGVDTIGTAEIFDRLATIGSLKAAGAGAAISVLFSVASRKAGDADQPTVV